MFDRLFVRLQHVLPQHLLSRATGWLTRVRWAPFRRTLVRSFMRAYGIDLSEALVEDPDAYPTFNAFFTRALKPGARPMPDDPACMACPVDGIVSQLGPVRDGQLLQAKGHDYSLSELLGGDIGALDKGAVFATLYLAPSNYHRIHMPLSGRLTSMRYLPGRLFSVNEATASGVPGLFTRNERVACLFAGEHGPFALVLVGALNVGSIETVWAGEVAPGFGSGPFRRDYADENAPRVRLERGEEMGRFNMGSTVIVVAPDRWALESGLASGRPVRVGERLAFPAQESDVT